MCGERIIRQREGSTQMLSDIFRPNTCGRTDEYPTGPLLLFCFLFPYNPQTHTHTTHTLWRAFMNKRLEQATRCNGSSQVNIFQNYFSSAVLWGVRMDVWKHLCMFKISILIVNINWDKPEWAPHLAGLHCASVCVYVHACLLACGHIP